MELSGVKKKSLLGIKENNKKSSTRAPSPSKRKDRTEEKSKDRSKDKPATKESSEKDRGRDKNRKRRSASSGSSSTRSRSTSTSSSGSSSSTGSSSGSSSSSASSRSGSSSSSRSSSSSSSSGSPSPSRRRHDNRRRSRSKSKPPKRDEKERKRRSPSPKPTKLHVGRLTRNVTKNTDRRELAEPSLAWGLKSGDSKSESELQVYRKENAALKKSLEEITKGKSKLKPEERKRLLEKILALQTENERYKNVLGERDEEIRLLRDERKSRSENSDVTSLLGQLEEKTKEVAKREQLVSALTEEANRLNSQLSVVTAKCADLENRVGNVQNSQEVASCCGTSANVNEVEVQLKDALEKTQQWLMYDQQREAYVHSLLARIFELEQQLEAVHQKQAKEAGLEEEKQRSEQLLATAQNDLEAERLIVAQLNSDLTELKRKYEEARQEVKNLNSLLMLHEHVNVQTLQDENHIKGQMLQRLTHENDIIRGKLDEEKKQTQALSSQVELLQRSLLKQQEEHTRMAALEQQIQACTSDFENEKIDRQNLQHQLNKVLKELHKARDQIIRLEPSKLPEHGGCVEVLLNFQTTFEDKLVIKDKCSSPKNSALDESFLECPKCKANYPTSQHRELLALEGPRNQILYYCLVLTFYPDLVESMQDHIMEIFSTYGKIKMIDMPFDRLNPHLSKGYAYVEFESPDDAEKALKHMDGGQIDGQEITATAVLAPWPRMPPRRFSPPRRMLPPPPMWRRSPPRMRRRSRSPRRRSPVRRRSRSRSPGRRRHRSRSSSNSSR